MDPRSLSRGGEWLPAGPSLTSFSGSLKYRSRYTSAHTRAPAHTRTRTNTHARARAHTHTLTHTHTHTRTPLTHTRARTLTCTHAHTHTHRECPEFAGNLLARVFEQPACCFHARAFGDLIAAAAGRSRRRLRWLRSNASQSTANTTRTCASARHCGTSNKTLSPSGCVMIVW
jgi:hypothetical protein